MSGDGGKSLKSLRGRVNTEAKVNGYKSEPCHHANTSMLELGLTEEVNGGEVGETEGIESVVTNTSIEIWWGLKERKGLGPLSQRSNGTC